MLLCKNWTRVMSASYFKVPMFRTHECKTSSWVYDETHQQSCSKCDCNRYSWYSGNFENICWFKFGAFNFKNPATEVNSKYCCCFVLSRQEWRGWDFTNLARLFADSRSSYNFQMIIASVLPCCMRRLGRWCSGGGWGGGGGGWYWRDAYGTGSDRCVR